MKKKIFTLAFLAILTVAKSQNIASSRWGDLFSYNNVLQIREDNGKLIAATENGIFYYTPASGEITKLSKANGLHEVKISAFDYNPETKTGLVGYANGTLDVIKEDGITYVVDIPLATGYKGDKRINHISITGNQAVISVGYGVSIYNLDRKEFGDTAFFFKSGDYEPSREAVIKDNTVYAATPSGVKKHAIGVTFPIYSSWADVMLGDFKHMDTDGNIVAFASNTQVQYGDGVSFSTIASNFNNIKDIAINAGNITVTNVIENAVNNTFQSNISVYNNGNLSANITKNNNLNSAWYSNGNIYAASVQDGILNAESKSFKPDGPYNNRTYKLNLLDDKIWVSSGTLTGRYYEPISTQETNLGFYFFNGSEWVYPSFFKNNKMRFNITDVIGNPSNYQEVFVSNFTRASGQGFYRFNYNPQSKDFDLEPKFYSISPNVSYNRPIGFTFDDKNNLFATSMASETEEFTMYQVYNRATDNFSSYRFPATLRSGAMRPIYYDGLLLLPFPRANSFGLIDLQNSPTNIAQHKKIVVNSSIGLPPASDAGTVSIAVDKNDDAWIGTTKGLRVISNIKNYNDPKANPIIIEQKGLGEELFRDNAVIHIEVDGGNQKWISVEGGGVFLVSENGQQTRFHFTKENSPLPSNTITDIKVDKKTGKVYFATYDGIVTYQSDVREVSANFGEVLVYPNPVVYANYKGNVNIRGLAERTNIRITDAAGNLVHQAVARGGSYQWDLTNRGQRVASGIYFVLMTNENGTDKATAKIAVVN